MNDPVSQEFRLLRICLSLNFIAGLIFMTAAWKYSPPAHHAALYSLLAGSLVYSVALYYFTTPRNTRISSLIFIFLIALFNGSTFFLQNPEVVFSAAFLSFTFISIFNIILVGWPEVVVCNAVLLLWALIFMLWPQTGFQASTAHLGIDVQHATIALFIYYGALLSGGTAIVQIKRRTEQRLRYMNANLNRLVEEKVKEIQRADQEKRQIQEQLETILRHSPVGVVIIDEDLNYLYSNGVHFKFALVGGELQEQPGSVMPLSVLKEYFLSAKAQLLIQGEDLIGQRMEYTAPDGNKSILRYAFIYVKVSEATSQTVNRLVLITEDITQEELLREKLIQANHLAALGRMAANLAHEVNNPLAGIKLYLELLEQGLTSPEKQKQIYTTLDNSVDRIDRIIKSFLTFARQDKPCKEWIDIKTVLKETLDMAVNFKPYHRINIITQFNAEIPAVYADQNRLARVFINLLNNARDAMQDGGQLTIGCSANAQEVVVSFADNGIGIKHEDLQNIFTPFFTTKPRGQGTGLGLAISYGIVQEHGGKLEVESREGVGTTFYIRLPVGQKPQETSPHE